MVNMPSKRRKTGHKNFQIARKRADARLKNLSNVVGTGFGIKERDNTKTSEYCLTVFVRKKQARHKLSKKEIIPSKVVRHGRELPTDVIEIRGLEKQGRFGIEDGAHAGTLGCFGKNSHELFGVSCAHCIGGPEDDPWTPKDIVVEYPDTGKFLLLGQSADAICQNGTGVFPKYGALDSGLIHVSDETLEQYAARQPNLPALSFAPSTDPIQIFRSLQYTRVQGTGAKSGFHDAIIANVFVNVFGQFFDLMITDSENGPLTEQGDSGLIWLNSFGRAVGFHMQGDVTPGGGPSTRAFAVFAYRVADAFGLTLLAA
jgi:hypothetical protein